MLITVKPQPSRQFIFGDPFPDSYDLFYNSYNMLHWDDEEKFDADHSWGVKG